MHGLAAEQLFYGASSAVSPRVCGQLRNSLPRVSKYGEQRGLWQQLVLLWPQVGCCATCFAACRGGRVPFMNKLATCRNIGSGAARLCLTACKRSAACGHRTPLGETASEMPYILHTEEYGKPSRQFGLPKAVSLDKVGGSAQKTNKFVLFCSRLALSLLQTGCISA